jgi:hypothetical protein
MANDLAAFGAKLEQVVSGTATRRVMAKAGAAGKKAALDAASDDLGDRRFSGMRRKVALSAGYDAVGDTRITINFRPAGLWKLAESGRRSSGTIRPRRGGRAVMTPQGPRASSSYSSSRGLNTFSDANKAARRDVPKAAAKAFYAEVGRVF